MLNRHQSPDEISSGDETALDPFLDINLNVSDDSPVDLDYINNESSFNTEGTTDSINVTDNPVSSDINNETQDIEISNNNNFGLTNDDNNRNYNQNIDNVSHNEPRLVLSAGMLVEAEVCHDENDKKESLTNDGRKLRDNLRKILNQSKRINKVITRNMHNGDFSDALGLDKVNREYFRCITKYYNKFAPYQEKILNYCEKNKDELRRKYF